MSTRVQVRPWSRVSLAYTRSYTTAPPVLPSAIRLQTAIIDEVELHPNADSLYVSQIRASSDADAAPLTVCSGLVRWVSRDALKGRRVVVVTNLKKSKLRGIVSEAMVLAATAEDGQHVELVFPPPSSAIGDELRFDGFTGEPAAQIKPKAWQAIQPQLFVDANRRVVYRDEQGDHPLVGLTSEAAYVETLESGTVS